MGLLNYTIAKINELLGKVDKMPETVKDGKTPVLETGTTTTLSPAESATSEVVRNGEDSNGNPRYKINLGIPKGRDGAGGSGGGVADSVEWSNVLNKPSWVNSTTKPVYTASDVGALPADTLIPSKTSQLNNDSEFVSRTGLKTINGQSIVGTGNITISGGAGEGGGNVNVTNAGSLVKGRLYAFNPSANGSLDGTLSTIPEASSEGAGLMGSAQFDKLEKLKDTYFFPASVLSLTSTSSSDDILTAFGLDPATDKEVLANLIGLLANAMSLDYNIYIPNIFIGNHKCGVYASQALTTYTLELSYIAQGGRLRTVKVTGKTDTDNIYSVVFLESGDDTYYLPPEVLDLTDGSTKNDIDMAFGGADKLDELFTALKAGKAVYIYTRLSPVLYPVSVKWSKISGLLDYLHLVFNQCFNSIGNDYVVTKSIFISIVPAGVKCRVKTIYLDGYPINGDIYDISSSSTSDEISTAVNGELGMKGIIKAIKDRNRLVINLSSSGAIELSGVYTEESNGDMNILLSGIGYGLWGGLGGICIISYKKNTSEFSASIMGVNAS